MRKTLATVYSLCEHSKGLSTSVIQALTLVGWVYISGRKVTEDRDNKAKQTTPSKTEPYQAVIECT